MGSLLKRLSSVRWGELSDSTGSAVAVPALLSKAAWSGGRDARNAIDQLADRVCELGFVLTEATASVVPFLVELAAAPEVSCRSEALELVAAINSARQWSDAAAAAAPQYRSSYDVKVSWEEDSRAAIAASKGAIESLSRDADENIAHIACRLLNSLDGYSRAG
ncbi:hypothetical protein [Kitasatospora sp. NPDC101183]|uniref:hypothetical protein n=1 Tax=Kitasatospora sp. NPDC101183 TaxID=3364100 RepID=UPI003812CC97